MSDLLDILQEFSNTYNELSSELVDEIYNNLKNGKTINMSVDSALESTDFISLIETNLVDSVVNSYMLNNNNINEDDLKDAILNTPWIDNISLQDRLNNIGDTLSTQLKDTLISNSMILDNIANSVNLEMTDTDIYNLKRKIESLLIYITNTDIMNTTKAIQKFKEDKDDNSKAVLMLLIFGLSLPLLKGIMERVLNVTYKDKYIGLNNTEGARANYEGLIDKNKDNNDVFGYRWLLSPAHYRYPFDICDVNANSNVGFGKGVYPKNKVPIYPAHKHCMCIIKPVTKKELGKLANNTFTYSGINKYISGLSNEDRSKLFTKSNLEKYNKNGDYKLMNSYSGFESPKSRT